MSALIELKGIVKKYEMGEEILFAINNVTFTVEKNEYLAIMGPSGSGEYNRMP